MKALKDISIALESYGKAFRFIHKNHMKRYFLVPIILNILLFSIGFHYMGELTDFLISSVETNLNIDNWDFWGGEYLSQALLFLLWLILKVFFFFLVAFIGGHIVLIILSPLLAYLSEKTEKVLTEKEYPFSFAQLLKDMGRGIRIALRNFVYELFFIIILFVLSFFPLLGFVTSPLLFLIACYYYGFSFLDYTVERRKLTVSESVGLMKRNKGLVVGNGLLYALTLLIPFVGVALSSFVAIISVVAATISFHKKGWE